jgi:hypothetical protein
VSFAEACSRYASEFSPTASSSAIPKNNYEALTSIGDNMYAQVKRKAAAAVPKNNNDVNFSGKDSEAALLGNNSDNTVPEHTSENSETALDNNSPASTPLNSTASASPSTSESFISCHSSPQVIDSNIPMLKPL